MEPDEFIDYCESITDATVPHSDAYLFFTAVMVAHRRDDWDADKSALNDVAQRGYELGEELREHV